MNNAIKVKANLKFEFLEAVRLAGFFAEHLKSVYQKDGYVFYRIFYHSTGAMVTSQDALFRVGVFFAQLTWSKADDYIIDK